MKPSAFDYVRARSPQQVFDLLAQHGDDARVLAGGQTLLPALNMRLSAPSLVVDDAELIPAAQRLVAKLVPKSSLVLRRMKALVDDGLQQPSETALRLELLASEVHSHSHDMREGLAAFEEKRKPQFKGC